MDQHKKTCYHCGEDTGKPTIANQYPLCDIGLSKGWKNKSFTIIAKTRSVKRAKTGNISQVDVVEDFKEDDTVGIHESENKEDDAFDDNADSYEVIDAIEENGSDEDEDDETNGVESALVSGSKKRDKKSKKTKMTLINDADTEFIQMHGRGDFASLPCNNFSNVAFLSREDNKIRNKKD